MSIFWMPVRCSLGLGRSISRMTILAASLALLANASAQDDLDTKLVPKASAEQSVLDAIKAPDLTVVHLWALWCSNCQAELKSGGWLKMVKDNAHVKFYFVSVWNGGEDGRAMLKKIGLPNQENVII